MLVQTLHYASRLEELGKLKGLIWEMLTSVKIILSAPTIKMDKHNTNENNINSVTLLQKNDSLMIKRPNIKENPRIDMAFILTMTGAES